MKENKEIKVKKRKKTAFEEDIFGEIDDLNNFIEGLKTKKERKKDKIKKKKMTKKLKLME